MSDKTAGIAAIYAAEPRKLRLRLIRRARCAAGLRRGAGQGRAHALWHHFYNSPFNVVAVQAFAQWLHPQLFADLDPKALLATTQQRFQPDLRWRKPACRHCA